MSHSSPLIPDEALQSPDYKLQQKILVGTAANRQIKKNTLEPRGAKGHRVFVSAFPHSDVIRAM